MQVKTRGSDGPVLSHFSSANLDGEHGGQASCEVTNVTHPLVREHLPLGQIIENAVLKPTRLTALAFPGLKLEQATLLVDARVTVEVTRMETGFFRGLIWTPMHWMEQSSTYQIFAELRPDSPRFEMEPGHLSGRSGVRTEATVAWELPAGDRIRNTELDVCPDEPRPCLMSPNLAPILAELANLTHWNSESTVVLFVQPAGLQQGGLVFTNRLINQPFWYVIAITFWLLAMFQLLMYYTSVRNIQLSIFDGPKWSANVSPERAQQIRRRVLIMLTPPTLVVGLAILGSLGNFSRGALPWRTFIGFQYGMFTTLILPTVVGCGLYVACAHERVRLQKEIDEFSSSSLEGFCVQKVIKQIDDAARTTRAMSEGWVVPFVSTCCLLLYLFVITSIYFCRSKFWDSIFQSL